MIAEARFVVSALEIASTAAVPTAMAVTNPNSSTSTTVAADARQVTRVFGEIAAGRFDGAGQWNSRPDRDGSCRNTGDDDARYGREWRDARTLAIATSGERDEQEGREDRRRVTVTVELIMARSCHAQPSRRGNRHVGTYPDGR